jgi:hypothetical protein
MRCESGSAQAVAVAACHVAIASALKVRQGATGDEMALGVEDVVNGSMDGEEALR